MPLVGEIMTDDCQCIGEHQSVRDAARRLAELKIGALPICGEDDRLTGMITDRDITVKIVAAGTDPATTAVRELAAGTPVCVEADDAIEYALERMAEHGVRRMPVIKDGRLVGIISQGDIACRVSTRHAGHAIACDQVSAQDAGNLLAAISASPPNN